MSESLDAKSSALGGWSWDRKATLAWIAVVLALNNLPYLLAVVMTRDGYLYSGVLSIPDDVFSYFAKMRLGYEGLWHYENRYTPEGSQPSLLFMFYVFLGHVARWLGLGIVATYHLARVASSIFLMWAVRRLIYRVGLDGSAAFWAFVLCFGVSGLGWLPRMVFMGEQPIEQYLSEAYCFITMLYFTHLTLSTGLFVVIVTEFFRLRDEGGLWSGVVAGVCAFLVAWIHPRLLLTAGVIGIALGIERIIRERRAPWRLVAGGVVVFISGLVPAILIVRSYQGDVLIERWVSIPTWSPPIWITVLGYGVMLPMAVAGAWSAWLNRLSGGIMLAAWMVLGFGLCYFPWFNFQRRLFQGLDIPMALLAGYWLDGRFPVWLRTVRIESAKAIVASKAGVAFAGNVGFWTVLVAHLTPGFHGKFPWYMSDTRWQAMEWLKENTRREEVVLSSFDSGQMIPAFAGNRVVTGHWAETPHEDIRRQEIEEYFDARTEPAKREELLERYRVDFLLFSNFESFQASARGAPVYNPIYDVATWRVANAFPSPDRPEIMILKRRKP